MYIYVKNTRCCHGIKKYVTPKLGRKIHLLYALLFFSESITYNFEDTKEHKIDFNDILDELMTRLVISVDDRRCIELNVSQEAKEQKLLEIVNKRGETNKTVCIDVLKQNSGYDDLTIELTKTISVTSPTDNRGKNIICALFSYIKLAVINVVSSPVIIYYCDNVVECITC